MYLSQPITDEGTKIVHLEKRSLGGIAGGVVVVIIILVIALLIPSRKRKKARHNVQTVEIAPQPAPVIVQAPVRQPTPAPQPAANQDTQLSTGNAYTTTIPDPRSVIPTNQSEYPDDLVPPYTPRANENDMGHFDDRGAFHSQGVYHAHRVYHTRDVYHREEIFHTLGTPPEAAHVR